MSETSRIVAVLREVAASSYGPSIPMTQVRKAARRAADIIEDQRKRLDSIANAVKDHDEKDGGA